MDFKKVWFCSNRAIRLAQETWPGHYHSLSSSFIVVVVVVVVVAGSGGAAATDFVIIKLVYDYVMILMKLVYP